MPRDPVLVIDLSSSSASSSEEEGVGHDVGAARRRPAGRPLQRVPPRRTTPAEATAPSPSPPPRPPPRPRQRTKARAAPPPAVLEAVAVARAAVSGSITMVIGGLGGGGAATRPPPPRSAHAATRPATSAAAALAGLRVCLDAALVTHPTGHALLPALAAAGVPHRVSRVDHPLTGVRTVLFSRVEGGGAKKAPSVPPALLLPQGGGGDENAGPPPARPETALPYVLACLTAADFVALCDAAATEAAAGSLSARSGRPPEAGSAAHLGLARLASAASAAHPGATVGLVVEGLDSYLTSRERADVAAGRTPGRQRREGGGGSAPPAFFIRRPYDRAAAIAAVHFPTLRLRLVPDAGAAAEHAVSIAVALGTAPAKAAKASDFVAAFSADTVAGAAAVAAAAAAPDAADPAARAKAVAARALARLPGVPPAAATAIAAAHGTFGGLLAWVAGQPSTAAAAAALADLRAATGRGARVGPAAAKRVVAFLTAEDGGVAVE